MEKKNRKNRKPLIVVAMLLMVALVVGMGAMTYSRYVSSFNSGDQTATAAKWGYVVSANTTNLFGDQYKKDGANATAKVDGSGAVVVDAVGTAKVVAPGTKGSMTISVNGVAEVLARLTFSATVSSAISFDTYMPIQWTVSDGTTTKTGTDLKTTLESFTPAEALTPGTEISTDYTISWEWLLDNGANADEIATNNKKDTIIGFKAAEKDWDDIDDARLADNSLVSSFTDSTKYGEIETTLTFSIIVTVQQVQA